MNSGQTESSSDAKTAGRRSGRCRNVKISRLIMPASPVIDYQTFAPPNLRAQEGQRAGFKNTRAAGGVVGKVDSLSCASTRRDASLPHGFTVNRQSASLRAS
jgi:hypothetical protein